MSEPTPIAGLRRSHLAWGWVHIALYMAFGLGLEVLHALKVGWYLDVGADARRLMFQLAHAHGTLLGLLHIAFASSLAHLNWGPKGPDFTARLLKASTVLLPGGFVLGGVWIHGGDPGVGVLPAPLGGLLLVWAGARTARAALRK